MPIVQILIFASYSTCFDIFSIVDNAIYVMVMFLVIVCCEGWSDFNWMSSGAVGLNVYNCVRLNLH